jgi:hypothetical protein
MFPDENGSIPSSSNDVARVDSKLDKQFHHPDDLCSQAKRPATPQEIITIGRSYNEHIGGSFS